MMARAGPDRHRRSQARSTVRDPLRRRTHGTAALPLPGTDAHTATDITELEPTVDTAADPGDPCPPRRAHLPTRPLAEGVGFEPTEHCCSPVFKTGSIGRSDSPPEPRG